MGGVLHQPLVAHFCVAKLPLDYPKEVFDPDTHRGHLAVETPVRFGQINPENRLAFAIPSQSARHTQTALSATLSLLPSPPQIVLSDNGSKFEASFAQTLQDYIQRWYTYPKSPKMNAHLELEAHP